MILSKRTKGKNNADKKTKHLYESYINSIKPIEGIKGDMTIGSYNISEFKHNKILKECNIEILNLIIKDAFEFNIPFKQGTLRVKKRKVIPRIDKKTNKPNFKSLGVNWGETLKLWSRDEEAKNKKIRVFYSNDHSNNFKYTFFWSKKKSRIKNKYYYGFVPARKVKRFLAQCIKNPELNINYFE